MNTPLPKFTDKTLEDLVLACLRLEALDGKVRQLSLDRFLSAELLEQLPEQTRSRRYLHI